MSIRHNMARIGVSHVVVTILSSIIVIIVTRHYGPEQYGAYALSTGIVVMISLVAGMGLQAILVRDLAISFTEAPRVLIASLVVLGTNSILSFAIIFVLSYLVNFNLVLCLWVLATSTATNGLLLLWAVFRANEFYKPEATVNIMKTVLYLVVVIGITLWLGSDDILHIAVSQFVLSGVILLYTYKHIIHRYGDDFRIHRLRGCVTAERIRYLYNNGFRMVLISIGVVIYTKIDIVMIGNILNEGAVGIYTVGYRFFEIICGGIVALIMVLYPHFAKISNDEDQFNHKVKVVLAGLLGVWVIVGLSIYLSSAYLVNWLFGEQYSGAIPVLQILAVGIGIASISSLLGMLFRVLHMEMYYASITVCGACINILLNMVLIPTHGIEGAAVSTVITYVLVTASAFVVMRLSYNKQMALHTQVVPRWTLSG